MPRKKKLRKTRSEVKVSGMRVRSAAEVSCVSGPVSNRLIRTGADPTVEVTFELPADWDGKFPLDPGAVKGTRVKPVVVLPEELVSGVDRHALRTAILDAGALYCKVPFLRVIRRKQTRDRRHAPDLPLEESLRIFAEETKTEDPEEVVKFAAALAREADAGATE